MWHEKCLWQLQDAGALGLQGRKGELCMSRIGGLVVALTATIGLTLQINNAVAAAISWSSPQNISGDSDVSTLGSLVGALNIGAPGVGDTTVNGVDFFGLPVSGNSATSGGFTLALATGFSSVNGSVSSNAPFATLSPSYRLLLSSFAGNAVAAPFSLTISGLNIGDQYQFEWWANTTATTPVDVSSTATNTVTLSSNVSALDGGLGQFVIGTFTADSSGEVITFNSTSQPLLDSLQLRDTTPVPEPATLALLSAGLLALGVTRRKK
jgi:hypothetical protein